MTLQLCPVYVCLQCAIFWSLIKWPSKVQYIMTMMDRLEFLFLFERLEHRLS